MSRKSASLPASSVAASVSTATALDLSADAYRAVLAGQYASTWLTLSAGSAAIMFSARCDSTASSIEVCSGV